MVAEKRVLRHHKGTPDLCVRYSKYFPFTDAQMLATATIPTIIPPFQVTCACSHEDQ